MKDLEVRAVVGPATSSLSPAGGEGRREGAGAGPAKVSVSFTMPGMNMGRNEVALEPGPGGFSGKAVLVRCPSGRKEWAAEVAVSRGGAAPAQARFPITVAE
jgi:hypothetical protein